MPNNIPTPSHVNILHPKVPDRQLMSTGLSKVTSLGHNRIVIKKKKLKTDLQKLDPKFKPIDLSGLHTWRIGK
jgi:hypothetical protein